MVRLLTIFCVGCALAAVAKCQDMTSLMLQELGMDPIPMPPIMPQSLREHLYPGERQRQILRQQLLQRQKQKYLAYLAAQQQQQQAKANPYNAPYTVAQQQPRASPVFSPANMIRQPGAANSAGSNKGNPYSIPYQDGAARKVITDRNPYGATNNPALRGPMGAQANRMMKTMKVMRDQPRKVTDAKAAGCKLPVDNMAASVLLFTSCRNPSAQMVCQAEFMTCMNIGMTPMCCPYGVNSLALDTISYVNKLQHYISEMA